MHKSFPCMGQHFFLFFCDDADGAGADNKEKVQT